MLFRKPIVCGISCLGMDHIDVLGDTIDEIADHKAGIMKAEILQLIACTINTALSLAFSTVSLLLQSSKKLGGWT
eukprot:m.240120 g.240120  ORF g.240120 m.240120 type:complete len:75 (+) comp40193_c0_seq10:355-579(+)